MPDRNGLFIIIIIYYYYQCFQRFMNDWLSVRRLILYNNVLNSNISAYRKGQSITTVLQVIRDDIVTAMKRSEVTMMILADFSKAFDTICFRNLITKMSKLGSLATSWYGHSIMLCIVNNSHRSMTRAQRLKTSILGFPKAPSSARCYSIFMLLIFRRT